MTQSPSRQNLWYVKKADILKQLSPEEVTLLQRHSHRKTLKRGEILFQRDEDRPQVFIVDRGFLRLCRMHADGRRIVLALLGPAEFFGALTPEMASDEGDDFMEAVREVRLIVIDAKAFSDTLRNHPDMSLRVVQVLESRNRTLEKRISSLLFKDVYARTVELLLELRIQYGEECPYAAGISRDLPLTHQEIADLVGAARPTVSQILGDLIKADLIHKHKQFLCLQDLEGLRRVAESGVTALRSNRTQSSVFPV